MVTIATEIEVCLTSKPLTHLYKENDYSLLTPNHLIYGHGINADQITGYKNDVLEIKGPYIKYIRDGEDL